MKKKYPFIVIFLLSVIVIFFISNILVLRYERKARGELEKNIKFTIESIQSRLVPFLGIKDSRELLFPIVKEIMDEYPDLMCVEIKDSLKVPYFKMEKNKSCNNFELLYAKNIKNNAQKWILKQKNSDVFIYTDTASGVFGGKYYIFYVLTTRIFTPLYSLRLYFNLLAAMFILMELITFILLWSLERKLARYRETLISFEQATVLDRLAGYLSHEIKNPLFVLSGNIELSELPEEDKKILLSEIKRIRGIVERYGNVFKRNSQKKYSSPCKVLKDIEGLFRMQFTRKGLSLSIECDINKNINIPVDQFKQIAINLILNALQARSSINIRCISSQDKLLRIFFCSSGEKIPHHIQKRMFEPYFSTKKEWTGLGLFVAKTIVEGYGGRLFYKYSENKNCFIVEVMLYEDTDN